MDRTTKIAVGAALGVLGTAVALHLAKEKGIATGLTGWNRTFALAVGAAVGTYLAERYA